MPITIDIENLGGAVIFAGAVLAASILFWRTFVVPTQRWFRHLDKTVQDNLAINGEEQLLPMELRNLGTRSLLIRHIIAFTSVAEETRKARIPVDPAIAVTAAVEATAVLEAAATMAAAVLARAATDAQLTLDRVKPAAPPPRLEE